MVLRHPVHAQVHERDVRVVVDPPQVLPARTPGVVALAVCLPVRDTIDAVGEGFFGGPLQSAPNEVLDVVVEGLDLFLDRGFRILGGKEGRLAQPGVVAGDLVDPPAHDTVVVVGPEHDVRVHGPLCQEAVVPERGIAVLVGGDEGRALRDERLQRLGGEELEVHVPVVAETDRETVLAELGEARFIDLGVAVPPHAAKVGLLRVFRVHPVDRLPRAQRESGREIRGNGHAGHHVHIDQPLLDQNVPGVIVVVHPAQRERIGLLVAGCERQLRVGLPPVASAFRGRCPRRRGVDEDPVAALRFPVFEAGVPVGGDHEVRAHAVGACPCEIRTVPRDEAVLEHRRRRVLLPSCRAIAVDGEGDREVPDLEGTISRVPDLDGPSDRALPHREADIELRCGRSGRAGHPDELLRAVCIRRRGTAGLRLPGPELLPFPAPLPVTEDDVPEAGSGGHVLRVDGVARVPQAGDRPVLEGHREQGGWGGDILTARRPGIRSLRRFQRRAHRGQARGLEELTSARIGSPSAAHEPVSRAPQMSPTVKPSGNGSSGSTTYCANPVIQA